VPDAWLAAVVSTSRATLMTFDRGFRRFPGLDVVVLGADT
jgi:predicted nucleic acid-binding protein